MASHQCGAVEKTQVTKTKIKPWGRFVAEKLGVKGLDKNSLRHPGMISAAREAVNCTVLVSE